MIRRWWAALLLVTAACSDNTAPDGTLILEADFNQAAGWTADFVDVPASQEPDVQFEAGTRSLPDNLGAGQRGLYHAGTNISDDLFMFFRKQVSGLEPGTTYRATFELTFASTAGAGCDVGPSSIWIKAGLSPQTPTPVVTRWNTMAPRIPVSPSETASAAYQARGGLRSSACVVAGPIRSSRASRPPARFIGPPAPGGRPGRSPWPARQRCPAPPSRPPSRCTACTR